MDEFNRKWIIEKGVPIVREYGGDITIRGLHYRLFSLFGMPNTLQHYKRVIAAMIKARWEGLLQFDSFKDHERQTIGETPFMETYVEDEIEKAKENIQGWMNYYFKNRWENQPYYVEVFIEKKALIGVFQKPCADLKVALSPCKGYPSLTFIHDATIRIEEAVAQNKKPVLLYFGDYDPSGEDIPRSLKETIFRMGTDIDLVRVLLLEDQVLEWDLPPAPTKIKDTRSKNWGGIGQVELDAIEPRKLQEITRENILNFFDGDLYDDLEDIKREETVIYRKALKKYVENL